MFWLTSMSSVLSRLAAVAPYLALVTAIRKMSAGKLIWQSQILPLAVLLLIALGGSAGLLDGATHPTLALAARLSVLVAAALAWPALRRLTGGGDGSHQQAQSGIEMARAEASESRHWLRMAEKIARVGHWRYNLGDGRMAWSDEVFTIFGLSPDDCKPGLETLCGLVAPADRERARRDFEAALSKALPFEFTLKFVTPGRAHGYVTTRGVPELDEAGRVTALFGVFVDITEQKRIEEELKSAHQASEVANRVLEALARHDALTRLPNRRHFDDMLTTEFRRAARDKLPVGLIMIDLDHFKAYNDEYGHPAGDNCLRRVAEAIAAVPQRPADLVARYGGEELVVMLPNTNLSGTENIANMIVQAVRKLHIPHGGNPERVVTISCGAATFNPEIDPHYPMKLVERADQALYRAKRSGRNRAESVAVAA